MSRRTTKQRRAARRRADWVCTLFLLSLPMPGAKCWQALNECVLRHFLKSPF